MQFAQGPTACRVHPGTLFPEPTTLTVILPNVSCLVFLATSTSSFYQWVHRTFFFVCLCPILRGSVRAVESPRWRMGSQNPSYKRMYTQRAGGFFRWSCMLGGCQGPCFPECRQGLSSEKRMRSTEKEKQKQVIRNKRWRLLRSPVSGPEALVLFVPA